MPLRLRLTLFFLLVSVPPVLIGSFVAAQVISATFERNVEKWIGEIARFMANEASEGREEARHATSIVAAALSRAGALDSRESIAPFADLLASVGYDFVRLYTPDGRVLFSAGELDLVMQLPKEPTSSIFFARQNGRRAMMVGAVQELHIGGEKALLLVANLLDDQFFTAPQTIRSLDLHLIEVTEKGRLLDLAGSGRVQLSVPDDAFAALLGGADIAMQTSRFDPGPAVAFAALRNDRGRLVGIIACRLNGTSAAFERLGTFWLFIVLAVVSGALSLLVGITISRRLAEPIRTLTGAVRAVAQGDYRVRVPEEGGRELQDLAAGFNAMAGQLEALRDMETSMRHRAQLATLGQAAAVIAHEIRNPLGIIKTSAELVRRKTQMAPGEDRLMGFVLDEVNRIERLVKELLDYARPAVCAAAPLDLVSDVVRPALDFLRPEFARRDITLALRLPDAPVPVVGDADLLHQALLNLLLNAMDAAGPEGHVILRVTFDPEAAVVEVEDNGPGIAETVSDTLFDPFVTTKVNGTGLGLATVRSTVEAHGGQVFSSNAPEGGAILTLRIPVRATTDTAHGGQDPDR
ncbi:HAMP domain-containing sensor histidine kinase [Xanthobacter autotrophicus DSM 431]|uniref:sensor histidine kinase n=1 Tax=Xanthobacter nonsaccharivorans TaxID=3119912 RepID=UPI00372C9529